MPTWANKTDANQNKIVRALEYAGWAVKRMNILRGKWLDLAAAKSRITIAVECKMPGEPLTESEEIFFNEWPGEKVIAFSGADAIEKCEQILRSYHR